jgi:hypothetical protein
MDTIGLLSRNLDDLELFLANPLLPLSTGSAQPQPKRFFYCADFFPHDVPEQQQLVDKFAFHMERHLGTEKKCISIASRWAEHPPAEDEVGKDIRKYLAKVRLSFLLCTPTQEPPNCKFERVLTDAADRI